MSIVLMEIIENNGDGTSSIVRKIFDEDGDLLLSEIVDMYDNETGTSLIYNEVEKRWEYPKGFFEEN